MNNMGRVISEYKGLLIKAMERKDYLRNLYNRKLNLYYNGQRENILEELETLKKEINNINENITTLNNFLNECIIESVNGFDEDNKKLFYLINNSGYLYVSLLNHFRILENNKINNKYLNIHELLKILKINRSTLELDVFLLLEKLGFNMKLKGTNLIAHLICKNIYPSENLIDYDIMKNFTNKKDIILSMEYSTIYINLDNVDKELFNEVFPNGISTNYRDVIKEISNYLKKEKNNKKTLKNS